MKLAHLSDLHLGKRVNEFSMIQDQRYILKEISEIVREERVQGVLIAGDVYDKAVPSAEAVQLLDEFLTGLIRQKLPVFVISGNHDSAERLAFGASLLAGSSLYISSVYDGKVEPVTLRDEYGEVSIYLLPFLKPAIVKNVLFEEDGYAAGGDAQSGQPGHNAGSKKVCMEISTYEDALRAAISMLNIDVSKRNVLVAHQFVTGAGRCNSEDISVGGLDNVDAEVFEKFDYVALGHIHGPQQIGRETLRYCGTPLKYSFSEANQQKSVTIVELMEKGAVSVQTVPLKPLRDLRKIRGTYMEVTARSFYEGQNTEDYLHITLTDEEDIPNAVEKLRTIYPNLMRLEYDNKRTRENRVIEGADAVKEKSELELLEEFYESQNNERMSEVQREFVKALIEKQKEGAAE